MHIADAILHANSAGVVFFLVTSYLDAVRHDDVQKALPETCVGREYRDAEDIERCLHAVIEREAQKHSGTESIAAEIRRVFGAALKRLRQLEQGSSSRQHKELPRS